MSNKDDIDYDAGSYRCEGSIEHFKFRVCLELSRTSFHQKDTKIDKKYTKRIEKIFHWMEKTSEQPQDQNDLEETSSSIEGKLLDSHLKTEFNEHNNSRQILHDTEIHDNILLDSFKKISFLKNYKKNVNFFTKNIIDDSPSDILKLQNRLPYLKQIMHVFLDLGNNSVENEENNLVLVSLHWNSNSRIMTIFPDFTNNNCTGYILPISTVKDSCFEYRFWIENLSNESLELITDTVNFHLLKLENNDFYVPKYDTLEIFTEIKSASGFEYDNLFIRYYIDLPSGWKCANTDSLQGTTHTCRRNNHMTSIFSYLFNVTLIIPKSFDHSTEDKHINSAFITFVIYSIDSWNKERIEGYSSYQIPKWSTPISYKKNIKLEAWLPKSRSCVDNLRRYFIGGSIKLSESNYTSIPPNFNDKLFSKFGMEIEQRGTLDITFSNLKQCCKNIENSNNTNTSDIVSAQALVKSVNNVMASFKRARKRMLLACQPILSS